MALSGTLETFSLPDVLRLLASTQKTGLLSLEGDRGIGRVWVEDGQIVAADSDRSGGEIDGVVFDLLRFENGEFEFANSARPDEAGEPRPVDDALTAAEALLEEWRAIEAVVPSLDVWVALVAEIEGDVIVQPDQWRVLAHVGTGVSAHGIAEHLTEGEFEVCRQLRALVDQGLVEVHEDAPESQQSRDLDVATEDAEATEDAAADRDDEADESSIASHDTPPFEPPAFASSTIGSEDWTPPERLGTDAVTEDLWDDASGSDEAGADDAPEVVAMDAEVEEPGDDSGAEEIDAEADDDADEFLTQLAHLSPKAAAAIEATANQDEEMPSESWSDDLLSSLGRQTTVAAQDEMDQDDADPSVASTDQPAPTGDTEDGELNQNLLLRFLSSTKQ